MTSPITSYNPLEGLVSPTIIKGFPYKEYYCPYCQRQTKLMAALHIIEHPEIFKAAYLCDNSNCGAFDEEARKAYVKEYYSCDEAFTLLQPIRVSFKREER